MFFYEILLSIIICFFCVFLYSFISYYLNDKRYKHLFYLVMLLLMTTLILTYSISERMLVFLDIPLFLGYLNGKSRDSLYVTFILIISFLVQENICWYFYLSKYILYFISYLFFRKNSKLLFDILLGIKVFFYTLIYFKYYSASIVSFVYLILFGILFYILVYLAIKFLKLKNSSFSEEKQSNEKIVFRIVHEIKNPIAVCKGYLEMLDVNDIEKTNKYLKTVKSEMSRALVIMDDFLNVGNINVKKDILDIYMLLDDIKNTMNNLLSDNNVILEIPEEEDEFYIEGDYDRLKQVFLNLVKNSVEAHATFIRIRVIIDYDKLQVVVTDNGDGISNDDLSKIGEMFFTTKSGGTGIGVNLSKEIISLHQGEIKYSSRSGLTRASVFLPIKKGIN